MVPAKKVTGPPGLKGQKYDVNERSQEQGTD